MLYDQGRKAKRKVKNVSDGLLVDLRDAQAIPIPVARDYNRLHHVPSEPHRSPSSLLRPLPGIVGQSLPVVAEGKKPKPQRKRRRAPKGSEMDSKYVPPHLRTKVEQQAVRPTPQTITLPPGDISNAAHESSQPPVPSCSKSGVTSTPATSNGARASAVRGKRLAAKHVRIEEPIQISHSTRNTTPSTLVSNCSTPTAPTVLTQLTQSPCSKVTTLPKMPTFISSSETEKGDSKPKTELALVKKEHNNPRRAKQPSGWLTKEERKAIRTREQSSDSEHGDWGDDNWDSNNIQNLVDWEGNWLPAPVEWKSRRVFKRHNYFENIADWIDEANITMVHMPVEKNDFSYVPKKTIILGELFTSANLEIAPRDWIPVEVDNQTLQTYWRNLHTSDLQPVDKEDADAVPFWLRYRNNDSDFQIPLKVPDADLDPADEVELTGMYRKGKSDENTSNEQIQKRQRLAKMTEKQQKAALKEERRRLKAQRQTPLILPPPDPNRPKVNIYLRPATLDDAYQITEFYNWYVEKTSHVSEMVPLSVQDMRSRLDFIERNALPIIVAVLKSNKKPPRGTRPTLHTTNEKIVGIAYAEDHEGRNMLHRYCAEVEVYVHQEYLGKGVGKSLLDRLMWLLDPQYKCRDLVEWRFDLDNMGWSTAGGRRIIDTLFANATYNSKDQARLIWITRWLEQFGFAKKAELEDCGVKLGHASTKAIFQAKTGANVDPRKAAGVPPL